MKKFKVGDVIRPISGDPERRAIRRRILKVRRGGYDWEYPDIPGKTFSSVNGTDPDFFWWELATEES